MKSLTVFREAFNSVKTRYTQLTVTALVLTAGIFVYYFFFLNARSQNLDERQYRVLNRVERQLRINLEGYKSLALGQTNAAVKEVISKHGVSILETKDSSEIGTYFSKVSFLKDARIDSGNLVLVHPALGDTSNWNTRVASVRARHDVVDSLFSIQVIAPIKIGDLYFQKPAKFDYVISIGALIRPLLRKDMFDQFMVLKDSSIVYETTSSGLTKFQCDTTSQEKTMFEEGEPIRHIVINGVDYRVYKVGFSTESETGWTIVGLKTASSFANERRTLPRPYLFGVFILSIFIVLSIPFIKSMIMSRTERMNTTDVIFSAISLALTTSIVSILLLDGYLKSDLDNDEQENQLVALSSLVEKHLTTEIDSISSELRNYSSFVFLKEKTKSERQEWIKKKAEARYRLDTLQKRYGATASGMIDSVRNNDSIMLLKLDGLISEKENGQYNLGSYAGFNNLFLVDKRGQTVYDIKEPTLSFNVKSRRYVSAIVNGECMNMSGIEFPVFLDAIISWREQQFRGVLSMPILDSSGSGYNVAVMTTRFRSLTNPILPKGSGFCIFDQSGNVFFHSDSTHSLNENILEECNAEGALNAAITGRTSAIFNLEYSGTPCAMYVRPIASLPYFIATFSQRAPVDAIHGQVFGMAFVLQILLFSFYVGVILLGLILLRKKSRLHISLFDLSAFTPDRNGRARYVGALLFNALTALLLFCTVCFLDRSLTAILLFFIAGPYTIALNMILLSGKKFNDFLTGENRTLLGLYLLAVIVANAIALNYVGTWWILPLIQIAIVGIFLVIENRSRIRAISGLYHWVELKTTYRTAYAHLVFTLVLLTCVIPAVSFAVMAYNKEKEIQVKTAQLSMLNQMSAQNFNEAVEKDSLKILAGYYNAFFGTVHSPDNTMCPASDKHTRQYDAFSSTIRKYIQSTGEKYNRLKTGAYDSLWRWCYQGSDRLVISGRNEHPCQPDFNYQLNSKVPFFFVPNFVNCDSAQTWRFWVCLLVAIFALHRFLRFFSNKVFVHERYSRTRSLRFDHDLFQNTAPGYKAFVTGMPAAGKSAYFKGVAEKSKRTFIIDFMIGDLDHLKNILKKAMEPGEGIVLLDHFEHDILNKDLNIWKLELIEQLVSNKEKKVIIISSIHPGVFTNSLIVRNSKGEQEDDHESIRLHERWNRVLAAFYDFVYPLRGFDAKRVPVSVEYAKTLAADVKLAIPKRLIQLVESECDHGMFLRSIGLELIEELHIRNEIHHKMTDADKWMEREDLIIKTQKLADNYYRSIWNHLAVEEQFILYDLAQDGLVNPKNLDIVESLIDKGIVDNNNRLRIMNRSFRNFILCVIGPADIGDQESKLRTAGAWSKLKFPLILIVCALLLFIVKSDRSQLFGYFTAFAAIIPVVVALLGVFGQANKKD